MSDPVLAAQVYSEEAGHFLDTHVNRHDARGDEGEIFRRLLHGERLTHRELATIRAENDHGFIKVDLRDVEVEFWSLSKSWKSGRR